MARQPITPEQWADARIKWESDDRISYADIGEILGVSKQAVAKKAKADGWSKRMNMQKVAARAQSAADHRPVEKNVEPETFAAPEGNQALVVDAPSKKTREPAAELDPSIDTSGMTPEERAEALAIQKRAEIIANHRREITAVRAVIYQSIRDRNFELGKVGKINAEALTLVQNAERKAWGLDTGTPEQSIVVLDRG